MAWVWILAFLGSIEWRFTLHFSFVATISRRHHTCWCLLTSLPGSLTYDITCGCKTAFFWSSLYPTLPLFISKENRVFWVLLIYCHKISTDDVTKGWQLQNIGAQVDRPKMTKKIIFKSGATKKVRMTDVLKNNPPMALGLRIQPWMRRLGWVTKLLLNMSILITKLGGSFSTITFFC